MNPPSAARPGIVPLGDESPPIDSLTAEEIGIPPGTTLHHGSRDIHRG